MELHRNRIALAVAVVLIVVTAGCGGASVGSGGDGGNGAAAGGGAGDGGDGGDGGFSSGAPDEARDAGGDELAQLQQRQVIFTGQVVLEVDDFEAARRNLSEAARARGGFVSDARAQLHRVDEERYRTGVVVLRVPRENFSALMERVEAGGTVVSSETSSQDVTDQLVDIEARLSSLRAERERLRALFDRANETEDVLAVERRLSEVQTEIERLSARQQSLERRVAYSTITVELREAQPEPTVERWHDVGVVGAFLESVDGVVVTLRASAVAIAYALPYLLAFGVPLGAIAFVARRRL
ncbi:MAG TPA: DUF4349 domain-containing protein [Halobacteriales archaeon]|nr:DUF4349 domain-containing protein [Halobacteriales archaeon]